MKIELSSGREIFLNKIYQDYTYDGLLLGHPNKEMNDRYVKNSIESAREMMSSPATYLVSPPLIEVEIEEHYKDAIRMPYITCYGQFESSKIKGDEYNDGSWLTIIWYQEEFAMPIDSSVTEHIKTISWEEVAEGYQF